MHLPHCSLRLVLQRVLFAFQAIKSIFIVFRTIGIQAGLIATFQNGQIHNLLTIDDVFSAFVLFKCLNRPLLWLISMSLSFLLGEVVSVV